LWQEYYYRHDVMPGCSHDEYLAEPAVNVDWFSQIHAVRTETETARRRRANGER
jgi:hypothetical protein